MLFSSEADARINIDQLLKDAGWDPADKQQVSTEVAITLSSIVNEIASTMSSVLTDEGPAASASRRADYILHAMDGKPLAIVEAKRIAIDPYRAKQQALAYARAIGAPFIFLSNGDAIYFWDYLEGDARLVSSFFSQRDLERIVHQRKNRQDLTGKDAPGKAIVFAITKNHATRLAKILNDLHPEAKGDYAMIITSDIADPDAAIRRFKRESYPRVAVSVGMPPPRPPPSKPSSKRYSTAPSMAASPPSGARGTRRKCCRRWNRKPANDHEPRETRWESWE